MRDEINTLTSDATATGTSPITVTADDAGPCPPPIDGDAPNMTFTLPTPGAGTVRSIAHTDELGGSVALDDLTDVTATSPATGDLVMYTGSGYELTPFITPYIVTKDANSPYATIQAAINAAVSAGGPQVVLVGPGTYTETPSWTGGQVTLRGFNTHGRQEAYHDSTNQYGQQSCLTRIVVSGSSSGLQWTAAASSFSSFALENIELYSTGTNASQTLNLIGASSADTHISLRGVSLICDTSSGDTSQQILRMSSWTTTPSAYITDSRILFGADFNSQTTGCCIDCENAVNLYVQDTLIRARRTTDPGGVFNTLVYLPSGGSVTMRDVTMDLAGSESLWSGATANRTLRTSSDCDVALYGCNIVAGNAAVWCEGIVNATMRFYRCRFRYKLAQNLSDYYGIQLNNGSSPSCNVYVYGCTFSSADVSDSQMILASSGLAGNVYHAYNTYEHTRATAGRQYTGAGLTWHHTLEPWDPDEPTATGDWDGADPDDTLDALDRIAARIVALHGTGP